MRLPWFLTSPLSCMWHASFITGCLKFFFSYGWNSVTEPGLCFSFYNSTFLKTEGSLSVYKISSSLFSEKFSAVVYLNCFSVPFGFLLLRNLFCLCWILFCTVPFLRFSSTVLSSFYFPLHLLWFSQACLLCQNFNFQLVIVHSLLIDLMS